MPDICVSICTNVFSYIINWRLIVLVSFINLMSTHWLFFVHLFWKKINKNYSFGVFVSVVCMWCVCVWLLCFYCTHRGASTFPSPPSFWFALNLRKERRKRRSVETQKLTETNQTQFFMWLYLKKGAGTWGGGGG